MKLLVLIAAGLLVGGPGARAGLALPSLFSDHMVLQRGKPVPVWGSADAGQDVTLTFAGQTKSARADAAGRWQVMLEALAASEEPAEMTIRSSGATVTVADVLVGDVWLASGQSNMGFSLASDVSAPDVLPKANDPRLRFFKVATTTGAEPQRDVRGRWDLATVETAKGFSAVAYFFAREIRQDQHCPLAVLQAPWGGTSIETWISLQGLKQDPPLAQPLGQWDKAVVEYRKTQANPELVPEYQKALKRWQADVEPAFNAVMKQYNDDKAAGKPVGPKPQPPSPEPDNPDPMGAPNPSKRPGTPTVNFNGMIAPLIPCAIRGVIWYQGENNGSAGLAYRALFPRLIEDWRQQWKQRSTGASGDYPFLFVQLPNNGPDTAPVASKGWPWLREAQLMTLSVPATAMAVAIDVGDPKNVHPASKLEVGRRLALAARKLAYDENVVASGPLYRDFSPEGNGAVRVRFREIGSGLVIGQSPWLATGVEQYPKDRLIGFFVAGPDKKWVEAEARIEGDSVIVSSAQVPQPVAVRYGWANSPRCNLYNKEGLPASPFRTDDWPE